MYMELVRLLLQNPIKDPSCWTKMSKNALKDPDNLTLSPDVRDCIDALLKQTLDADTMNSLRSLNQWHTLSDTAILLAESTIFGNRNHLIALRLLVTFFVRYFDN